MTVGALQRAIGRAAERRSDAVERCGLCAAVVAPEHRHVLDDAQGGVACACPACTLLLDGGAAGGGHYLLIPDRRTRLTDVATDSLNVPVGLAFFVRQADGRVLAHYPSPLGTTESAIDPDAWRAVERSSPAIAAMRPRVEALLVRASGIPVRNEHWILPLDDCFRLVAVIRQHWTGMAGGSAVWREIARFFAELDHQTAASTPDRAPSHAQVRGGADRAPSHAQVRGGASSE
jgi:Family of unknown function (DUF5947)